jgi:hypothetical protein
MKRFTWWMLSLAVILMVVSGAMHARTVVAETDAVALWGTDTHAAIVRAMDANPRLVLEKVTGLMQRLQADYDSTDWTGPDRDVFAMARTLLDAELRTPERELDAYGAARTLLMEQLNLPDDAAVVVQLDAAIAVAEQELAEE